MKGNREKENIAWAKSQLAFLGGDVLTPGEKAKRLVLNMLEMEGIHYEETEGGDLKIEYGPADIYFCFYDSMPIVSLHFWFPYIIYMFEKTKIRKAKKFVNQQNPFSLFKLCYHIDEDGKNMQVMIAHQVYVDLHVPDLWWHFYAPIQSFFDLAREFCSTLGAPYVKPDSSD